MLLVQKYLQSHSLADLYRDHAVKARISEERPYKCSLNYDQIEARDDDALAQECRGLVVRTADGSPLAEDNPNPVGETIVLGRGLDRFFNMGQGAAAPVNLHSNECSIFDKADGTLCILHYDDLQREWHVATRAVCEANLPVGSWGAYTFRTLFEKALADTMAEGCSDWQLKEILDHNPADVFPAWSTWLDKSRTYMFELCTPVNQVVVTHSTYRVILIGCRDTLSGYEYWPHTVAPNLRVPSVERFRFGHPDEMLEFVRNRDPKMFEGIVACEEYEPGCFRRVKVKNAQYLAYSRLKDSIESPRNVMMLILGENLDDAFVVMPEEIKTQALKMQEGIRQLFREYDAYYPRLLREVSEGTEHAQGSKEHRKAFALAAKASGIWFEPAMMQYTGKCKSARDFVEQKRDPDGSYPNSFLDYLITQAEKANAA